MKNYTFISQNLKKLSRKLNLIDAAILDEIIAVCAVQSSYPGLFHQEANGLYRYTLLNLERIIKDLPMLRIKAKSSISERIDKIEKEGFIKTLNKPDGSLYVRLEDKAILLLFDKKTVWLDEQRQAVRGSDQLTINKDIYRSIDTTIEKSLDTVTPLESDLTAGELKKIFLKDLEGAPFSKISKSIPSTYIPEDLQFINFYKSLYKEKITPNGAIVDWGVSRKLTRRALKFFSLDELKKLLHYYFKSDDPLYRQNVWSITCFLSIKTLNKLNALHGHK